MKKFAISPDDLINPIAVKELRQAVKGRSISWALIVFLIIQLAIIGFVLMMGTNIEENFSIGRGIFTGLLSILLAITLFFVPAYTAVRFSSERSDNDVDLFFITTLSPSEIIWGKLSSSIILVLLFFSASLPFMTLTYLLRGLDLPTVFLLLAFDFLVVLGCTQLGIFLASLPGKLITRILRFLMAFFLMIGVYEVILTISYGMLSRGMGSIVGSRDFWGPALTIVSFILLAAGFLFILSVAVITPASANRAFAVRLYLLFTWLFTGIISTLRLITAKHDEFIAFWALFMVIAFSIHLLITICERQSWQPRVAKTIPKNIFMRILAFIFYSGAAGGIIFSVLMMSATILVMFLLMPVLQKIMGFRYDFLTYRHPSPAALILVFPLYAVCYALTAFNLKNFLFKRLSHPASAAVIALILLTGGSLLPVIFAFIFRMANWEHLSSMWFIGNPFALFFDDDTWLTNLFFTGAWASIIGLITLPTIVKQARMFKPFLEKKPDDK